MKPKHPRLTRREKETLERILRGLSDKLIAADLGVSHGAVRRHVTSLMRKYAVNSRLQIAMAFLESARSKIAALRLGR